MRKAGFIGGLVSIFLGAMTLVSTGVINEVLPKIAYIEFQKLVSGSYSPDNYAMNFHLANAVAIVLIVCGVIFGAYCFVSETRSK